MKIKSLFFAICAIAVIFSSCAELSTLSVERRHYRNGYYIDYRHSSSTESTVKNTIEEEPSADLTINDPFANPELAVDKKSEPIILPEKRVKDPAPAVEHSGIAEKEDAASIKPAHASKAKSVIHRLAEKKLNLPERQEDELSMFWSVILLIVVIWLIAYFTGGWGLGGLINLLLLVALILFILWILRVV